MCNWECSLDKLLLSGDESLISPYGMNCIVKKKNKLEK